MKIITPIDLTEDMIVSPIAEPDASVGEVEWIDPNGVNEFGSLTKTYNASLLATNGYVYAVGSDNDDVMKVDPENKTVSYFGDAPDGFSFMFQVEDYIYCIGSSTNRVVIKINTLTGTTSSVLSLGDYSVSDWALSDAGNIYGATNYESTSSETNVILKIDTETDTLSTFGAPSRGYGTLVLSTNGDIYGFCDENRVTKEVLKINTQDDSITEFGSYSNSIFTAKLGSDGGIYAAGNSGSIVRVDTDLDEVDLFTSSTGYYVASVSDGDFVYFVAARGLILAFSITEQSFVTYGENQTDIVYTDVGIDSQGRLMASGGTTSGTDSIMIVNTNNNELEEIHDGYSGVNSIFTDSNGDVYAISASGIVYLNDLYNTGDQVILTETHKVYECVLDNTQDDPATGSVKVPPSWAELYSTNRWRMFDYTINSQSEGTSSFILKPAQAVETLSLFGLSNVSQVKLVVREDSSGGSIIYNETIDLTLASPDSGSSYLSSLYASKALFEDIPAYDNPYFAVQGMTRPDDSLPWYVGAVVVGNPRSMGIMTYLSSTSRTSFDTVEIDDFGNEETISRPSAEYTSFEMVIPPAYADYVERILKDSLNNPRVYFGNKKDGEKIFTFGRYERSPISYDNPAICTTNLKVRGLV